MIDYIATLLPRIQQFSKGLNDTAIFADVPWAFIDEDGDKVTYIFRRNNELLVSKKGDVTTGHWEYLPVMQSLLIEHAGRKRMYNQGFVDNVVMALRKDGTEELFLLANQQVLGDLNAVGYLEKKANAAKIAGGIGIKGSRVNLELKNPTRLISIEVPDYANMYTEQNQVFDGLTNLPLQDDTYTTITGFKLEVENGRIRKVYADEPSIFVGIILLILSIAIIITIAIVYLESQ